ncbi:hypothetical protein GCM10022380_24480 [Amycolatopsis tucumanensis]|uniref:Uncharacterized protein n=1 Tax=Amycolatopsis tucumanensis TaxID=401106 RepID=A0ABP7HYJ6_9PSEU
MSRRDPRFGASWASARCTLGGINAEAAAAAPAPKTRRRVTPDKKTSSGRETPPTLTPAIHTIR